MYANREGIVEIRIFESELKAIIGEALRFPRTETGGDLYGSFTHGNLPVVWLASGPGPRARRSRAKFEQDTRFTTKWQRNLFEAYGIQYIGSWHSHHQLGLTQPSTGDIQAAQSYGRRHGRMKSMEILLSYSKSGRIIPRVFFYADAPNAAQVGWLPGTFNLLDGESPVRSRLGQSIHEFSGGIIWQNVAQETFVWSEAVDEMTVASHLSRQEVAEERHTALAMPPLLESEIRRLQARGITTAVEQRGDTFMVMMWQGETKFIAVALESTNRLDILQVNLIDQEKGSNTNLSQDLLKQGIISEYQYHGGTLVRIFNHLEKRQTTKTPDSPAEEEREPEKTGLLWGLLGGTRRSRSDRWKD